MRNTNTAIPAFAPSVTELIAKYDALESRINTLEEAHDAIVPDSERSQAAQESFLLAHSSLRLLQALFELAEAKRNGLTILNLEFGDAADSIAAEHAMFLVELMVEQLGVSEDAIKSAIPKDFARILDLIETVLTRTEEEAKSAGK